MGQRLMTRFLSATTPRWRIRGGWRALLITASMGTLPGIVASAGPAAATTGDFYAGGTAWCADTYGGHTGIAGFGAPLDINVSEGDDWGRAVYAPGAGTISIHSLWEPNPDAASNPFGNSVIWTSGDGSEKIHLAHLKDIVWDGPVRAGQLFGHAGSTGRSYGEVDNNGSHLHLSRQVNGAGASLILNGKTVGDGSCDTSTLAEEKLPGGWYISPSPPDGTVWEGAGLLPIGVHVEDNNNGGLERVEITVHDPLNGGWRVVKREPFGPGVSSAEVTTSYFVSSFADYLFSFDVFSRNGKKQYAPNGVRRFCTSSPCRPYYVPPGGSSTGLGGGCLPNPQAEMSAAGLAGDDGWFRSNVTVTLSGRDLTMCGHSTSVEYSLDGGGWTAYGTPFLVNGDGVHTLKYRARSGGVTGVERETNVKIDTVPPVIGSPTISAPIDMNNIIRDTANITIPWTDATSGVRWVKHRCGTDPFTQTNSPTATFALAGAGVTVCDSFARDIAGWEAAPWNSGPLIFNMLVMDASGMLEIDSATGTNVTGQARGGNFRAVYNTGTSVTPAVWLTGTGPVVISGNTNSSFATTPAPTPVPRLNYPFAFYQGRSVVMNGPLAIDNVNTPLPPYCIYVKGDIFIRAVKLNTKACLIAEGSIYDDSTATTWQSGDPANGVLMMAAGSIKVASTGNTNVGLLYAPDGTITFAGTTGLDSKGSAVAKDIKLQGVTNTRFSYAPGFAPTTRPLPLGSPFIPAPPTAPAPTTPVPGQPANGATSVGTTTCFTWTGSAPGYELQVATASAFDAASMVRSEGSLNTTLCAKGLPGSTKLYWRVRAVSLAGAASAWAPAASFTTKAADPTLSVSDATVTEGNSGTKVAQVTITRSGPTTGSSSVQVATLNGSATGGSDFAAKSWSTVSFSSGQASSGYSVTVNGDTLVEPDEYFEVKLASPTGATIADDAGRVTITNDDAPAAQPSLAVNDLTLTEGDMGTQLAQFTVSRSGPTSGSSTVQYRTRNGSAEAGSDFVAVPLASLTFSPGETSKLVFVTVNGDTLVEDHEAFTLELSSPTGATVADGSGTATLRNNDARLSIDDPDVEEGDSGTTSIAFTITREGALDGYSWVMYATANGTAVAPVDYQAVAGALVGFGPGESQKAVMVVVNGDTVEEPDETFRMVLSSPSGATIAKGTGVAEIEDDD